LLFLNLLGLSRQLGHEKIWANPQISAFRAALIDLKQWRSSHGNTVQVLSGSWST
jgi:hypothetical protein